MRVKANLPVIAGRMSENKILDLLGRMRADMAVLREQSGVANSDEASTRSERRLGVALAAVIVRQMIVCWSAPQCPENGLLGAFADGMIDGRQGGHRPGIAPVGRPAGAAAAAVIRVRHQGYSILRPCQLIWAGNRPRSRVGPYISARHHT